MAQRKKARLAAELEEKYADQFPPNEPSPGKSLTYKPTYLVVADYGRRFCATVPPVHCFVPHTRRAKSEATATHPLATL